MGIDKNLLSQLIKYNSSYPYEEELSKYLFNFLDDNGFDVKTQNVANNRFNILATKGSGKKALLFYGHMDTVPVSEHKNWRTNPLKATLKNQKLYGLGASDMKGGIAAFLEATKNTNAYVKILLAVDEENISEGAWLAVKKQKDFFNDVELIISAEPNFGLGLNKITIGRTGRCIYKIVFSGKQEHIIKYRKAIDAIKKLCEFGKALYSKRARLFKSKNTIVQIRMIKGEARGMSVCGLSEAEVEVILGSEDSVESVRQKLQHLTDSKVSLKLRKTPYLEGYYFKTFPHKETIAQIIKNHCNKSLSLHTRKSVGDDNVLATLNIPVITWGANGSNEHAPNEYVDLNSLTALSYMYKKLLDSVSKNKQ